MFCALASGVDRLSGRKDFIAYHHACKVASRFQSPTCAQCSMTVQAREERARSRSHTRGKPNRHVVGSYSRRSSHPTPMWTTIAKWLPSPGSSSHRHVVIGVFLCASG